MQSNFSDLLTLQNARIPTQFPLLIAPFGPQWFISKFIGFKGSCAAFHAPFSMPNKTFSTRYPFLFWQKADYRNGVCLRRLI